MNRPATALAARARHLRKLARSLPHLPLMRGVATVSLHASFGNELTRREIRRVALRCVLARGRAIRDFGRLLHGLPRFHEVIHAGPLQELQQQGKGSLICSMHAGPYPLIPVQLGRMGLRGKVFMNAGVRDSHGDVFQRVAAELGTAVDVLSPTDRTSLVRSVRALHEGEGVVILVDRLGVLPGSREDGRNLLSLEFLGQPIRARTTAVRLAARARAPIVLAFTRWESRGRRTIEFSDPMQPSTWENEADQQALVRRMFAWFEHRIRLSPQQWEGWFLPFLLWRESGAAPTASEAALVEERRRMLARVRAPGSARLAADPLRVALLPGEEAAFLYEGPTRRVMKLSPLEDQAMRTAFRGGSLRQLARRHAQEWEALADACARLRLAGVLAIPEER